MLNDTTNIRSGKRMGLIALLVVVLLIGAGIFFYVSHNKAPVEQQVASVQSVEVRKVSDLSSTSSFSTVGSVEAVSEAQLQTGVGGQVTSVLVTLGDHVNAGQILATIENSAQAAAVAQAEGALESAQVGTQSSQVGISSAQNGLATAYTSGVNTYKSAYISIDSALHNDVDILFSTTNGTYTGLRIDGAGQAPSINMKRNDLETQLKNWSSHTNTVSDLDIVLSLESAHTYVMDVSNFVDLLYTLATNETINSTYTDATKASYQALLSADRVKLNQTLQSIDSAQTAIEVAQKAVEQAQLAGSANTSSVSSAQLKIAQATLNAARVNYEKTIVRTPIAGVVNALYIKSGDYVSAAQAAAVVANNEGLEVTTSVSQDDSRKLVVGDVVSIDTNATGTIVAIAPALDPKTGKVEVKVSVQDGSNLINGGTVTVTFTNELENTNSQTSVVIPLTALKITSDGPIAFSVSNDQTLKAIPVTIGNTVGDSVVVLGGLTSNMQIVTDARGLKAGQSVTINK